MDRYARIIFPYILEEKESRDKKMGKHVCLIMQGNKVVSVGYSNNNRVTFCGMNVSSLHGEMSAVNPLLTKDERLSIKKNCNNITASSLFLGEEGRQCKLCSYTF